MGSVTLHSPSYSSVGQRYASISCTAVGWVYPVSYTHLDVYKRQNVYLGY